MHTDCLVGGGGREFGLKYEKKIESVAALFPVQLIPSKFQYNFLSEMPHIVSYGLWMFEKSNFPDFTWF